MPLPLSTMCRPEEQDVNQPQEPSPPNHVENHKNIFQKPPRIITCIHRRKKHCATPSRCTTGHNNLVQELDDTHKHCNCGDSTVNCATQPGHLSLHNNRRVNKHPKNCTCEISTVCCTVCTVRTKICMQLKCPPFCRGPEPKARRTRRTAGTAAA